MGEARYVVGVDLGGTHMQVGVVRADGSVVHRAGAMTHAERGAEAVFDEIAGGVKGACGAAGVSLSEIAAIGIGAPGAIDPQTELVLEAPNLGWKNVALAAALRERLKGTPIVVDNDVNVAVFGEAQLGAARGAKDVLGVWVGTGIGGGLILNGSLYRGPLGTAGEIGMTVLYPETPEDQMRMEHHCSRKYMTRAIVAAIEAGEKSSLAEIVHGSGAGGGRAVTAEDIAHAYDEGDPLVRREVDHGADLLGISIANAVTLLALPLVVIGGGLVEVMGEEYVGRVAASMRAAVHPPANGPRVEVRATMLRENAGLLGAAMLAWDEVGEAK